MKLGVKQYKYNSIVAPNIYYITLDGHHVVGPYLSKKDVQTKMWELLTKCSPEVMSAADLEELKAIGMDWTSLDWIGAARETAKQIKNEIDLLDAIEAGKNHGQ